MKSIVIVGAGGHSKVVTEVVLLSNQWKIVAYVDENPTAKSHHPEAPIFRSLEVLQLNIEKPDAAFVAIGDNALRKKWQHEVENLGYEVPILLHPSSSVSQSASIGAGTLIGAMAHVGPHSYVGQGVIINTGAIIDHDVTIGNFTHVSQGVVACGGAKIGDDILVGPGNILRKQSETLESVV